MIASVDLLDANTGDASLRQQVFGEFSARAGKVRPFDSVARHGQTHPYLRSKQQGERRQRDQGEKEGQPVSFAGQSLGRQEVGEPDAPSSSRAVESRLPSR